QLLAREHGFVAVARLTRPRDGSPIPAVLKRLASLAERGLVEIDAGEAARRQGRTEPHGRRTDRLRGASVGGPASMQAGGRHQARAEPRVRGTDRLRGASVAEPAIMQAIGCRRQRRALLGYLELQPAGSWSSLAELRGPFARARVLVGPLLEAGLVVEEQR